MKNSTFLGVVFFYLKKLVVDLEESENLSNRYRAGWWGLHKYRSVFGFYVGYLFIYFLSCSLHRQLSHAWGDCNFHCALILLRYLGLFLFRHILSWHITESRSLKVSVKWKVNSPWSLLYKCRLQLVFSSSLSRLSRGLPWFFFPPFCLNCSLLGRFDDYPMVSDPRAPLDPSNDGNCSPLKNKKLGGRREMRNRKFKYKSRDLCVKLSENVSTLLGTQFEFTLNGLACFHCIGISHGCSQLLNKVDISDFSSGVNRWIFRTGWFLRDLYVGLQFLPASLSIWAPSSQVCSTHRSL